MNTSGNHWNYEVLGGQYNTKSDAALGQDDEISLTSTMDIYVDNVQDNELTFTLTGGDFSEIIPEILGVEITSYPDTMKRNDSFTLKAEITGNNLTNNEKVFWSISENTSKSTIISSDGTLTIGGDEQSSFLVVSATTENNISTNITINLNIIHSLIHHDKVEATCSKEGIKENWYCEECNKYYLDANHKVEVSLKDLTIAKTNNHIAHIEIDYLEATCEENGHTEKIVCQSCGLVMQESTIIPAKGHRLSDYIIDKEPTETEEGSRHIECLTCHKIIKVEKIEKLPHKTNYVLIAAISMTAITIGTAIIVIIRKKDKPM